MGPGVPWGWSLDAGRPQLLCASGQTPTLYEPCLGKGAAVGVGAFASPLSSLKAFLVTRAFRLSSGHQAPSEPADHFLGHCGFEALLLALKASRHPERTRRQPPSAYCFLRTDLHWALYGAPSAAPWVSRLAGAGARSRGNAVGRVWLCSSQAADVYRGAQGPSVQEEEQIGSFVMKT